MQSQVKVFNKHVTHLQSTKLLIWAQIEPMVLVMRRGKLEWFKCIKENRKHQSSWRDEGGGKTRCENTVRRDVKAWN